MRYTWHPCGSSHATPPGPPSLMWLMRHQPALITCLHSRPCFWTLGPRPLSIVPTISVPFRYHTTLVNSPIGPRTHLASPLLSPHCFSFDPQPVSPLSFYGSSIVLANPFVPHSDNGSHVALLFCTVYKHPLYRLLVPILTSWSIVPGTPFLCIRYSC